MKSLFSMSVMLGALFMMGSVATAFAADARRMAEMQKSLNAEVQAQPFSVSEPAARPAATAPTLPAIPEPRCVTGCGSSLVYPSLSFGLHFGHHRHYLGWRHGHRHDRYGHRHHGHRRHGHRRH